MKKSVACLLVILALIGVCIFCLNVPEQQSEYDYLRIHVRANSNSQTDQSVKYIVKDEVVKFITPHITECVDKESAIKVVGGLLDGIEEVCDAALKAHGFDYGAKAEIRQENFPTRVYGELTLEQGVYDALIVELGSGTGDNWWCVIYPPLCFTSGTNDVQYRSAIMEIIKKFFDKNS